MAKKQAATKKINQTKPNNRIGWVYLLLGALLIGLMYGQNLSGDVWWHLKTGQWIVVNHSLPFDDPFSYTARNPMILHEWAAEVVQWLIYSISPSLLALGSVALISTAFILTFKAALRRSGNALISFLVIAISASASIGSSEMRPQVFTFVFLALTVWILQKYNERGGKTIWLLAPLIFVWVNFHALFLVGLGLIGLETIVALIAPPDWAKEHGRPRLAAALPLLAVGIVSAMLALINPNGLNPFLYPLHVLSNAKAMQFTCEWTPPSIDTWNGRALLALIGMAVVGIASHRGRVRFRDLVYLLVFGAAAARSQRHAVLFAITCSAPIAVWLSCVGGRIRHRRSIANFVRKTTWAALTILVAVLLIWRISDGRGKTAFNYMNKSEVFPSAACDFLQSIEISGPMFNDANYGGYLIWRLWPKHRVFVDSRQEPFLGGAYEEAITAINCTDPPAARKILMRRKINFVVLNPNVPLAYMLAEKSDQWTCIFLDEKAVIFVRNTPKNAKAISAIR